MGGASELAYQRIRGKILSGDLAAGEPLGEEVLAELCGVSRTPVREALRRLEDELFVRRTASQRSFVADWSAADIRDIFELRAMLEGYAARRAAERMDDATLKALAECNAALGKAIAGKRPDIGAFLDHNREFHSLVLATAASIRLTKLLGGLVEQSVIWRTAHHYDAEELERSHHEHGELLAAFERADGAWAEAIMASHIHRAFHAFADRGKENK